jgi:hypothetical protein
MDAVLCSPPIGLADWGHEDLAYDARWTYGTPPRTEPELAWAQHALAHLAPGGTAVLLMPPAAASRRAGRRIRAELLRRGALAAVVALPPKAAASHAIPLHIWVLRRPGDTPPPTVLFIDAAAEPYARVLDVYRRFLADPAQAVDEAGFARAVSVIELLDEEVDLNPARRPAVVSAIDSGQRFAAIGHDLESILGDLPSLLPRLVPSDPAATPTTAVGELVKAGALQVLGPVRVDRDAPRDDRPGWTARDLTQGNDALEPLTDGVHPLIEVEAGDVLVPVIARDLVARVVTTGGGVLGPNVYLLRVQPAVLNPWFLAGQLTTSTNQRQAASLSGVSRYDVRKAQVARLPLGEQHAFADAFQRLTTFERALRRAHSLGTELIQLAGDGLARGILQPAERSPKQTAKPTRTRRER